MQHSTTPESSARVVSHAFRRWFFSPPRPHGQLDEDRVVSFLELFYDLVFVVLVAQVAHTLAVNVTGVGVFDFATVFMMIWVAWLNGSLYQDLHGGNDGPSRLFIFGQMAFLVLLAVYAGHATTDDGAQFAVVYALLLAFMGFQWWRVRRVDRDESDRRTVSLYATQLWVVAALMVTTIWVPDGARTWMWLVLISLWILSTYLQFQAASRRGVRAATEAASERFGLLVILVLGEVVVGAVNGLIEADRTPLAIVTGVLALAIGTGFWWNYFDSVGRRMPIVRFQNYWLFLQLPIVGAIAAAGAGMISLIEHSSDATTPPGTAWLLAASSATYFVALAAVVLSTEFGPARSAMKPVMTWVYLLSAGVSLLIGWWAPVPWLLATCLALVHTVVWTFRFGYRAIMLVRFDAEDTGIQL